MAEDTGLCKESLETSHKIMEGVSRAEGLGSRGSGWRVRRGERSLSTEPGGFSMLIGTIASRFSRFFEI